MLNLHRVMRGLNEIGATISITRGMEALSHNIREMEAFIYDKLASQLSGGIYQKIIKPRITLHEDFGDMAKIYRVNLWVLTDEDLERVTNECYLQGVIDGRREADLLNKGRGEEGLGVSSTVKELTTERAKTPEGKQP